MNECNNNNFGIMSLKEFAKSIGKPESTIRTWRRRAEIPDECFVEIGKSIFIKTEKFKNWLENTS
ncbi:MAG: helix-turn-helix domain-containing protein [Candidatus Gastranaerophilales bacterium]|nr:helix-turn-helix domain-containing protein [Candidatus Gastranaerophilales bacterium]